MLRAEFRFQIKKLSKGQLETLLRLHHVLGY
jgi:hypothetical protein